MKIIAAFPTDGNNRMVGRHFGDAMFFEIYEIDSDSAVYVKKISNNTEKDNSEAHGDSEKASGISSLLADHGVNTVAARIFGPNIKRIKRKFACIMVDDLTILDAVKILRENHEKVMETLGKGDERNYLNFKTAERVNE